MWSRHGGDWRVQCNECSLPSALSKASSLISSLYLSLFSQWLSAHYCTPTTNHCSVTGSVRSGNIPFTDFSLLTHSYFFTLCRQISRMVCALPSTYKLHTYCSLTPFVLGKEGTEKLPLRSQQPSQQPIMFEVCS